MHKQPMPKAKTSAKPEVWGAGDPDYIKKMVARGKAARKAREDAKQGIYVKPIYGPIAGSAEQRINMDSPVKRPISPFKLSKKDMMTMEKEVTKSKTKPKARPTVTSKIKGKPTPLKKKLTGNDAIKEYQKSISPKGMAKFQSDAKKALEKKYPGMFIPETRTTSGVKKK